MEPETMNIEKEFEKITVAEFGTMGYGNAESSISHEKQITSGELSHEVDARSQEIILSGEALVAVNDVDDGCIDGRGTVELYVTENGEFYTKQVEDNSNHERAKVAGGGYITSQAMRLGVGMKGAHIDSDLAATGTELAAKEVYCGAHTGAHKHGDGTDCGANDKMQLILNNGLAYQEQVSGTTEALIKTAGLEFKSELFNKVLENWESVLSDESYFAGSTGASRLQEVLATQESAAKIAGSRKPVAVTKHLEGDHNEDYIVVNYVKGKTFSQGILAEKLRADFPDNDDKHLAQAFVVDAWRIVELAEAAVETDDFELALYAGVMYQVATAATLTDGSLKMFGVTEQ